MNKIFIAGTGTGIGKTLVSAIVAEALQADYWKPVQAGNPDDTDSMEVERLTSTETIVLPETYRLRTPASPHDAAQKDNTRIDLQDFQAPESNKESLVIEGAGGLMVPLNDEALVIDLIQKVADEVILVSRNYLGSINHTLLSIEALMSRKIPVKGIVFNGDHYPEGEDWILHHTNTRKIGHLAYEHGFDQLKVKQYAERFRQKIQEPNHHVSQGDK